MGSGHALAAPSGCGGCRKITVEHPLRLNSQASPEGIVRIANERMPARRCPRVLQVFERMVGATGIEPVTPTMST